jgi:hypothetical protein
LKYYDAMGNDKTEYVNNLENKVESLKHELSSIKSKAVVLEVGKVENIIKIEPIKKGEKGK